MRFRFSLVSTRHPLALTGTLPGAQCLLCEMTSPSSGCRNKTPRIRELEQQTFSSLQSWRPGSPRARPGAVLCPHAAGWAEGAPGASASSPKGDSPTQGPPTCLHSHLLTPEAHLRYPHTEDWGFSA